LDKSMISAIIIPNGQKPMLDRRFGLFQAAPEGLRRPQTQAQRGRKTRPGGCLPGPEAGRIHCGLHVIQGKGTGTLTATSGGRGGCRPACEPEPANL
jgi:hypothetical protein